jgi:branched-chain amino acid transport system substrate-binding protein
MHRSDHPTISSDDSPAPSGPGGGLVTAASLPSARLNRRRLLSLAGLSAAAIPLAACGGSSSSSGQRTIKIGYVSPQTGSLNPFGVADSFVVGALSSDHFQHGLSIGGRTYPVQIVVRDSESDRNRAADAASTLIFKDKVDIVLVGSTPDTTNPVSDLCEANGVPCISTIAPWQSWYFGRGGTAQQTFQWTYHFFWGIQDLINVYLSMWNELETNHKVGVLWPNDADGKAFADAASGFPPALRAAGYEIVSPDPAQYSNGAKDFGAAINTFKSANVDIITGVPGSDDFKTFWTQANQAGFFPKVVTMAKALLFPESLKLLGLSGNHLSTEVWWSPQHHYTSSLTNQSAAELAAAYTRSTGDVWVQTLGFVHALFEVAADALTRVADPDDRAGIARAIAGTNKSTIVGPISFQAQPGVPRNVATTTLAGGMWTLNGDAYNLEIVSNPTRNKSIPTSGEGLKPYQPAGT